RDRIISSHGGEGAQQKPVDDTEKVRVFRSEKGEEVVERRQGERVVIRRKKKQEEPAEEEAAQLAAEAGDASRAGVSPAGEEPGEPGEAVPEEAGGEEIPAGDEAVLQAQEEEALQGETNGVAVNGVEAGAGTAEAKGDAKPGDKDETDESAKKKKKVRSSRVKPKREEI